VALNAKHDNESHCLDNDLKVDRLAFSGTAAGNGIVVKQLELGAFVAARSLFLPLAVVREQHDEDGKEYDQNDAAGHEDHFLVGVLDVGEDENDHEVVGVLDVGEDENDHEAAQPPDKDAGGHGGRLVGLAKDVTGGHPGYGSGAQGERHAEQGGGGDQDPAVGTLGDVDVEDEGDGE